MKQRQSIFNVTLWVAVLGTWTVLVNSTQPYLNLASKNLMFLAMMGICGLLIHAVFQLVLGSARA